MHQLPHLGELRGVLLYIGPGAVTAAAAGLGAFLYHRRRKGTKRYDKGHE